MEIPEALFKLVVPARELLAEILVSAEVTADKVMLRPLSEVRVLPNWSSAVTWVLEKVAPAVTEEGG